MTLAEGAKGQSLAETLDLASPRAPAARLTITRSL
jgi:hypothetical protein